MRARRIVSVLALIGMIALPASARAPEHPLIGHRGRWLTDASGRAVIFHGVNMVMKVPPYQPSAMGFGDDDAAMLSREGFNTVRLGMTAEAVEPRPGVFDDTYLAGIGATVQTLGAHGIRVLLDMHQDLFNERFHGEGLPAWMVQDDGLPAQPDGGFPANYFAMPALWRAFDHFWANDKGPRGIGLQDEYALLWRHVAVAFRGNPAVLGYDLFNEPWPGTQYPTCLNPYGCLLFDTTVTAFFKRVIAQVRTVDPTTMVFYEPSPISSGGPDMHLGDTRDARAGLSFHNYCLGATIGLPPNLLGPLSCPLGEDRTFNDAEAQAARNGDAILLSEFGATDDLPTIKADLDAADRHMDSWQYWTYAGGDPCCPRPAEGIILDPSKPPTPDNLKQGKLDTLSRPYPRAIAGTPVSWFFDSGSANQAFTFVYHADPSIHAPTEVFIPIARHYAGGYTVHVTGPAVVTSAVGSSILTLRNTGEGSVTVVVARA